ncbi:hypothetical protein [Flavobacterium ovatum]|uniref:hypothetical protein n=1 Tax=Flavobacterium ovatum TaxID=1928857 RepID=UPI003450507B
MVDFNLLCFTVLSISAIHTLSGPDHYLPFIVLSRSKQWSLKKTLLWTFLCGFAHVLSSVVLGVIGILLGWTVTKVFHIEEIRGGYASWFLLLFGIGYVVYALINLKNNKTHKHFDTSDEGDIYVFEHKHGQSIAGNKRYKVTPWVMFFIFALGPSEPMIPLIIYPAINYTFSEVGMLIFLYTFTTIFTMMFMVLMGFFGSRFINYKGFEKYIELFSGISIIVCGFGMVFLEW